MKILKPLMMILFSVLVFAAAGRLLYPKYMSASYEGNLTAEYYASEKDHQVLFIGDCEVYENFSPMAMWREHGITSYIRGGAQQLVWHSYYTLEDTLYYETPDVVVFSVLAMKFGEPQSEAYNRLNLQGLRPSPVKARAVSDNLMPDEDPLSYFFPILRFHDRWSELKTEDFRYFFGPDRVAHNGFIIRSDIKPVSVVPTGLALADYTLEDTLYYETPDAVVFSVLAMKFGEPQSEAYNRL
ncbi:MAG: hypothetical protein LBS19_12630, partial [Clostridiales bacterium]|nr:hypothetical protein [Clostridiales bacterium]